MKIKRNLNKLRKKLAPDDIELIKEMLTHVAHATMNGCFVKGKMLRLSYKKDGSITTKVKDFFEDNNNQYYLELDSMERQYEKIKEEIKKV